MPNPRQSVQRYKRTLFDRYGPDAGIILQAVSYGVIALGLGIPLFAVASYKMVQDGTMLGGVWPVVWSFLCAITTGSLATVAGLASGGFAGNAWKRLMVTGASTPYQKQYSIQDAMVMQGRLAEAIDSFEIIISERPEEGDAYVKAAELHVRAGNHRRALELFRQARSIPTTDSGQDVYLSYRMIDLYDGPLGDRGRAIVELRRLIDLHPDTRVAALAREGLAKLKAEHLNTEPA